MWKRNICTWQDSIYEKRDAQQNLPNNSQSDDDFVDNFGVKDFPNKFLLKYESKFSGKKEKTPSFPLAKGSVFAKS